jgi:hypothetical protein
MKLVQVLRNSAKWVCIAVVTFLMPRRLVNISKIYFQDPEEFYGEL